MKPYDNLTWRGKVQRLRALAWNALQNYPFTVTGLELVGWYTNILFRVRRADGPDVMLRVCYPGWRTETDLRSEIAWLLALARETPIGAPVPIPNRQGEYLTEGRAEHVPQPHLCMVMSWVPGVNLAKRINEANLFKMGVLFTQLHAHGAAFQPPAGFTARKMSSLFARGEADVLFSEEHRAAFSQHSWDIFEQVRQKVERSFEQRYCQPGEAPRVIHNDLWHGNIKLYRGQLYPVDFEDTVWGYPVQDLAMAVQDLMTEVEPAVFESLLAALRVGYESRSAWLETYEGELDTFRAGRMLWVANHRARFPRIPLQQEIERMTPIFERFLDTGTIRMQPK